MSEAWSLTEALSVTKSRKGGSLQKLPLDHFHTPAEESDKAAPLEVLQYSTYDLSGTAELVRDLLMRDPNAGLATS